MEILSRVVGRIYTTKQVIDELKMCTSRNVLPMIDFSQIDIISLTNDEKLVFSRLNEMFGRGEASCLAICMSRHFKILTDDLDARKFAQRMGVPVSGTIGVIASAVGKEIISKAEADDLLSEMINNGFYSPIKSLGELDTNES